MILTPHEQQQVDAAVTNNCVCTEMDCVHSKSFRRGITFALDHLLPGRMERFAEWIEKNAIQNPDDERFWYVDGEYCDHEELVAKYLQHLETIKQKEDGSNGNS